MFPMCGRPVRSARSPRTALFPAAVALLSAMLLLGAGCGKKNTTSLEPASLADLNRALAVVRMSAGQRMPTTNDVAGFLAKTGKSFPVPPPGQKLVLNPQTMQFEFAPQDQPAK